MSDMKKSACKRLAACGVLAALALTLGYLEQLLPFTVGIYGVKLGLSNLAIVMALYLLDGKSAVVINVVRIIISSLLFGNMLSMAYSLVGGVLSTAVMLLIKRISSLGCVGVSICGGVAHNIGQLCVAMVLVSNLKLAFYLPVLLAAGAVTGFAIGACSLPVINNGYIKRLCDSYKIRK